MKTLSFSTARLTVASKAMLQAKLPSGNNTTLNVVWLHAGVDSDIPTVFCRYPELRAYSSKIEKVFKMICDGKMKLFAELHQTKSLFNFYLWHDYQIKNSQNFQTTLIELDADFGYDASPSDFEHLVGLTVSIEPKISSAHQTGDFKVFKKNSANNVSCIIADVKGDISADAQKALHIDGSVKEFKMGLVVSNVVKQVAVDTHTRLKSLQLPLAINPFLTVFGSGSKSSYVASSFTVLLDENDLIIPVKRVDEHDDCPDTTYSEAFNEFSFSSSVLDDAQPLKVSGSLCIFDGHNEWPVVSKPALI